MVALAWGFKMLQATGLAPWELDGLNLKLMTAHSWILRYFYLP